MKKFFSSAGVFFFLSTEFRVKSMYSHCILIAVDIWRLIYTFAELFFLPFQIFENPKYCLEENAKLFNFPLKRKKKFGRKNEKSEEVLLLAVAQHRMCTIFAYAFQIKSQTVESIHLIIIGKVCPRTNNMEKFKREREKERKITRFLMKAELTVKERYKNKFSGAKIHLENQSCKSELCLRHCNSVRARTQANERN